jgi:hypothetical protein
MPKSDEPKEILLTQTRNFRLFLEYQRGTFFMTYPFFEIFHSLLIVLGCCTAFLHSQASFF